jgi:glycosyltransferase involved in cell wall biosynthesis
MKVEVLCATMHQKDLSKYKEMNIQTDVVFANQADGHSYIEENIDGHTVKMITTPYRGVGRNRNLGLLHSSADILMFSDDDMVYSDGYEKGVIEAFESLPNADMIIFSCTEREDRLTPTINRISRARVWNSMKYGTYSFVIKRESLLKQNLNFSQLFGGGCRYCSGEDNLFVGDALKKHLVVYTHPFVIAHVSHSTTTWFEGFNEKYLFDNGAWLQNAFPVLKHLFIWYFVYRFAPKTELGRYEILRAEYSGMKAFKKGMSYDEWKRA